MLKDQNNPAVLGSIAEVLKKSNEVAAAERAKHTEAAAMRYEGWKVETDWKKAKPRSEKSAEDAAHNLAGQGLKKEKEMEAAAKKKDVKEEAEQTDEALDPRIAAAFAKVAKGVEVHMKHKETGKMHVAKFPGGESAVKAAKEHEAEMGKQGYEVHKRKMMEEKTLSELLDEARGRPRKNPAPVAKKSNDEDEDDYGPDTGPEADQNIQVHLKKSIDSEGEHHVKFADGSSHKVPAHVAHKVLSGLQKLKPADRAKAQEHVYQSHKNLMQVHKMLG